MSALARGNPALQQGFVGHGPTRDQQGQVSQAQLQGVAGQRPSSSCELDALGRTGPVTKGVDPVGSAGPAPGSPRLDSLLPFASHRDRNKVAEGLARIQRRKDRGARVSGAVSYSE